jgi:dienelactone hydrolase
METIEYAPDRAADVFGDPGNQTLLLWHGMQTDARSAVAPLAACVADHGFHVITPDWDSHATDNGRADLLASARFAADRLGGSDSLVLVGWSLGGLAAAGLTIHADDLGFRILRTICLAGAFPATDPISGEHLPKKLPDVGHRTPFTLMHGVRDDAVPLHASQDFAATLETNGWPVELVELDADHGSIAGAAYDAAHDRYVATDDPRSLAVAAQVAVWIAG